jgi:hypothetical protein
LSQAKPAMANVRASRAAARVAPMVPEIHKAAKRAAAHHADKPVTKRERGVVAFCR